jgi:hypothetical protein
VQQSAGSDNQKSGSEQTSEKQANAKQGNTAPQIPNPEIPPIPFDSWSCKKAQISNHPAKANLKNKQWVEH